MKITKKLIKKLLLLFMALIAWIALAGCDAAYEKTLQANGYETITLQGTSEPGSVSVSENGAVASDERTAQQIILDAFAAAGYYDIAPSDADAYLDAWNNAKIMMEYRHFSRQEAEAPMVSAEVVRFDARLRFPEENHVPYSVLMTDQLQGEYLISIWNPQNEGSPLEIQYRGDLLKVRYPVDEYEHQEEYRAFVEQNGSPEAVALIADLLHQSGFAAAKTQEASVQYANTFYLTMLKAFFCNGMEPALPMKAIRLIDFPKDMKAYPGQGVLIPVAVEAIDANDNVIQIIHTNPKDLVSEGVSAVIVNSNLVFWSFLRKD